MTIFTISLLLWGLFSATCAVFFFKLSENNLSKWERLPRNSKLGAVLAFFALLWCIPHIKPLLPTMTSFLLPTAIVVTILSYKYLDYLFSRALGGFIILLAHFFLSSSFAEHSVLSPVIASFCYIIGIMGLFFAGKPWTFRDVIRKAAKCAKWKFALSGFFALFAIVALINVALIAK